MTDHPHAPALPDDGWAEAFADALRAQRARVREFLAALGERQRRARTELESWIGQCQEAGGGGMPAKAAADDRGELTVLRGHRDRLEEKLSQTEQRLDQATERLAAMEERLAQIWRETPEQQPVEECRRREAALEDLRDLKTGGEEIQRHSQERSTERVGRAEPSGSILDWEAEKRRTLAALEAESDEGAEPAKNPRREIEQVLRRTDLLVADRNREIADLKRLLQDQSASLGSVAVGAAAVGDILDRDAIIQEERENLRLAQAEWQDKLRTAEIEISVERAKFARERAGLEDRLRTQGALGKGEAAADPAAKPDKSPPGRWLARLGLKDPKGA